MIEDAFGEPFDITLIGQEECDHYRFLRHVGTNEEFRTMAIDGDFRQVTYPPLTPEEPMSGSASDDTEEAT